MNRLDFIKAVDEFSGDIYRIAFSYCNNQSDAEDVTQNTFLKLLQSDELFNNNEHMKKWLFRVAINNCKDMSKSFWKRKIVPLDELNENNWGEEFSIEDSNLYYAITKLPQKYKLVIHLFYFEDYSIKEISEILNLKVTTVQTQLMRARNKLKETLMEDWEDEYK